MPVIPKYFCSNIKGDHVANRATLIDSCSFGHLKATFTSGISHVDEDTRECAFHDNMANLNAPNELLYPKQLQ